MLNQRIGAAIRAARLARGVTQEELARAFGVDRVTIARYEGGARAISAPTLLQLLSFLGREIQLEGEQGAGAPARRREPLDPVVARIVQLLQERPELVATVTDLFETLEVWPETEPGERAP
jgi:transcriptional regulator with XRE-family HTH domain